MRKFIIFSIFLIFAFTLSIPSIASAHSKLEKSKPSANEIVKSDVTQIELIFSTNIEILSTFKVKNSSNNEIQVNNLKVNEKEMTGTLDKPLENGDYTVEWKIVGKDGHPISGSYLFQIKKPVQSSANDITQDASQQTKQDVTSNEIPQQSTVNSTEDTASEPQSSSQVTVQEDNDQTGHQDAAPSEPVFNQHIVNYGIGAGIIIIVVIILLLGKRRRQG